MEVSSVPGLETGTTVHADEGMQMRARVWAGPGPRSHRRAGAPRLDHLQTPVSPALGTSRLTEGTVRVREDSGSEVKVRPQPS